VLLAGLAALALVLGSTDLKSAALLCAAAGPILILGLIPHAVQMGLDAAAWRALLAAAGRRVAWRRLFAVRLSTEAVVMSVPAGGVFAEGLKPYLVSRTDDVPYAETIATVALKRTLLVSAQVLYLTSALVLGGAVLARISPAVIGMEGLPWVVAGAIALLVAVALGFASMCFRVGGGRVHQLLARLPVPALVRWLEARRAGFDQADATFAALGRDHRRLVVALALLLGAWLTESAETWLLLRLVGVHLPVVQVLVMESCAVFVRNAVVFLPSGLGAQDLTYLGFLRALGVAGAAAAAPAFLILKRAKELLWIGAGYLVLVALTRERRASRLSAKVLEGAL